jgi:GDP/UDP-N,N'-diacetylbacillosamine 2-epimerase (hydrolysing)
MSKSLGLFLLSITDAIHNRRPDIILLAGDRGEQFMAAVAGAHMNVPVAHIQAGELSGNIDGLTRHAMARFVHIHFASNRDAEERLIRSGEQPFRVVVVGAPQLDDFLSGQYSSPEEVMDCFRLDPKQPVAIMLQHPVTEQPDEAAEQMAISLRALSKLKLQTVLIFPNNDAGSLQIRSTIDAFHSPWLKVTRTVPRDQYGGLMRLASVVLGNSSSGILEAPSFELPAVNIGRRQAGRLQARNVINVPHDERAIGAAVEQAIDPAFRSSLKGIENPYGDGRASDRIVNTLAGIEIDEKLLWKQLTY